jgi:DNA-binding transcriptional LysR family regulator
VGHQPDLDGQPDTGGAEVEAAEEQQAPVFRLLAVPGVTVDRWARTWSQRQPGVRLELVATDADRAVALLAAEADAGLVRLPVDPASCHAIPLYTEVTVVVVPRDHLLTAADELTMADLAGEALLRPADDVLAWPEGALPRPAEGEPPATTAAAVELVAAGVGVLVTPLSLARAYHRRELTHRVVTDAPTSSVALAWARDRHTGLVEEMIGIVRGRTANSTRGQVQQPAAPPRPAARRAPARPARPNPKQAPRRRGR